MSSFLSLRPVLERGSLGSLYESLDERLLECRDSCLNGTTVPAQLSAS